MGVPAAEEAAMTYEEALAYLFDQTDYLNRTAGDTPRPPTVDRMGPLMQALGQPQTRFQVVHVAGTKGKGSTSALCESMLHRLGYRTGLFTSPHLHTFRERIRVDQALIPAPALAELMSRLRPTFDLFPDLTVFDRITALAFQYFADQKVEWAVVEVGLGGRLDSTNVVHPAVCGITSISYDHMDVLGNTLSLIAREKAGIIKPGVPVFTCAQEPEAQVAIQQVAQAQDAPLTVTRAKPLPPPNLAGVHQQVNAGIAQAMIENLAQRGLIRTDFAALEAGIADVNWPGRFERLPVPGDLPGDLPGTESAPVQPILVDCAHNLDSMNRLLETLAQTYPARPMTAIMGAGYNKQVQPMLTALLGHVPRLVLVRSRHPRAIPVDDLMALAATLLDGRLADGPAAATATAPGPIIPQVYAGISMTHALDLAISLTPENGVVVGTGSVFVAAEVREVWADRYPQAFDPADWVFELSREPAY